MAKATKALKTLKNGSSEGTWGANLFSGLFNDDNIKSYIGRYVPEDQANLETLIASAKANPLGRDAAVDGLTRTNFGTTTGLLGNWIRDHKLKAAGIGALGGLNVAGLFDNPYLVGQLGGAALGGFGGNFLAKQLGRPLGTSGTILAALGGGALGSLFDRLMANKAEQQQYQGQY